jgi:chromate reductase
MPVKDITVFVGSLRKEAFSRKLAKALQALSPAGLKLELVEIGQLALYNQDLESSPPAEWLAFRERVRRADGVVFVTPEYNRSMPAALKNALDVGSRPYGKSVWDGKPGLVVSCSPGPMGAFGANHHLRQSLVFLNVLPLAQPEAYIGGVDKLFNEAGELINDKSREFFTKIMQAYEQWVNRLPGVSST